MCEFRVEFDRFVMFQLFAVDPFYFDVSFIYWSFNVDNADDDWWCWWWCEKLCVVIYIVVFVIFSRHSYAISLLLLLLHALIFDFPRLYRLHCCTFVFCYKVWVFIFWRWTKCENVTQLISTFISILSFSSLNFASFLNLCNGVNTVQLFRRVKFHQQQITTELCCSSDKQTETDHLGLLCSVDFPVDFFPVSVYVGK